MAPAIPNKLGITDEAELARVETKITMLATYAAIRGEAKLPSSHGIDRLTAVHKHLFGEIYEWGGKIRPTSLFKAYHEGNDAEGTQFTPPAMLRRELNTLFEDVRKADAYKGLGRLEFAAQGADFLARLNQHHAFREGNGRTQRLYLQLLAIDAGHELPMTGITQERMVSASIEAAKGDLLPLRDILDEQMDPTRRAALVEAHTFLQQLPDLEGRHLATTRPGQRYSGELVDVPANGEHFLMHDGRNSIIVGNKVDLPDPLPSSGRVAFVASRTRIQELDHRFNLIEQATERGGLSAAITEAAQALPIPNDLATRRLYVDRQAEAERIDSAFKARHHGITRPQLDHDRPAPGLSR